MSHPSLLEVVQQLKDNKPFAGLHISNNSILNDLEGRHPCPTCGKSRKFFCYSCYVPIVQLEGKLPKLNLPIKIDIIKHLHEIDGKSTASHAAILAPDHVSVYTYPNIPDYTDEKVVLIFPSYHALEIGDLFNNYEQIEETPKDDTGIELPKGWNKSTLMKHKSKNINNGYNGELKQLPITRAIFIDSTWNQSKGIYKDERINRLPTVVLQNRISQFWRHQKGSPRWYLATIEAIHQFVLEVHLNMWGLHPDYKGLETCFTENFIQNFNIPLRSDDAAYNGQYDDLLYFFQHMYDLIHEYYKHEELYAYKRRLQ